MTGPICPKRLRWLLEHHAAAMELLRTAVLPLHGGRSAGGRDRVGRPTRVASGRRGLALWRCPSQGHQCRAKPAPPQAAGRPGGRRSNGEAFALPEQADEARLAAAALESLPQQQRELVVAHIWGGLTFEQIGHLMGISGSTAHRQYHESLAAIRKRLSLPCPRNP